ncbi:hypothetical protein ACFC6U_01625 [Kitasatospora purpeofusca]|uniref:hypothetical protein n=1 Tax=Kitasatospora purpeofusca TaxID=67352 RepID=UPI0035D92143
MCTKAEPGAGHDPLTSALIDGVGYSSVHEDGRMRVVMDPVAFDAFLELFERRQRHLPVPAAALDYLRQYRAPVCAAELDFGGMSRCMSPVQVGRRCGAHPALGQVHPEAGQALASLSLRARRFWDRLVEEPWLRNLRKDQMPERLGVSTSTVSRSLTELRSHHLVVRSRTHWQTIPHPAVAFFGSVTLQKRELAQLDTMQRTAFEHLESAA